jgi:hypothetical protein
VEPGLKPTQSSVLVTSALVMVTKDVFLNRPAIRVLRHVAALTDGARGNPIVLDIGRTTSDVVEKTRRCLETKILLDVGGIVD